MTVRRTNTKFLIGFYVLFALCLLYMTSDLWCNNLKAIFYSEATKKMLGDWDINWNLLFVLSILIFFIAFKLLQYSEYIIRQKQVSFSDIALVVVFFTIIFMPMFNISDRQISEREKRHLAKLPSFSITARDYGKKFEAWYNDHFPGREYLINLCDKIHKINKIKENKLVVYDLDSKFFFHREIFYHRKALSKKEDILRALEAVNDFAKSNGIKFYLFIVPDKFDIYGIFHPYHYQRLEKVQNEKIAYIRKHADFPVIYPYKELKSAAQKDYVYFKTDHHWTEYGAYIGYKSLIKSIKKDFPEIESATEKDYDLVYSNKIRSDWNRKFHTGSGPYDANINDSDLLDVEYKYYDPKYPVYQRVTDKNKYKTKYYKNENAGNRLKIILTGTSMNENLLQFLPYSFNELKYFRLITVKGLSDEETYKILKNYGNDFLKFKPDILVLSVVSGHIPNLEDVSKY